MPHFYYGKGLSAGRVTVQFTETDRGAHITMLSIAADVATARQ